MTTSGIEEQEGVVKAHLAQKPPAQSQSLWQRVRAWATRLPAGFWQIVLLIVVTRIVLTLLIVMSRHFLTPAGEPLTHYISNIFLDVWGQGDTVRYMEIVQNGYYDDFRRGWFPLYPLLTYLVSLVVRNAFIAGIIVSNVSLAIACTYLYKLVRLSDDEGTAFRSVKYLLLWPTAFVFSAMLSESTFLAFAIASMYYIKKRRWWIAAALGYCASLTRFVGVVLILPFLYEYIGASGWSIKRIRADILASIIIPLGAGTYFLYSYIARGAAFVYVNTQLSIGQYDEYHRGLASVIETLSYLLHGGAREYVWLGFVIVALLVLVLFARRLGVSYWLLCAGFLFIPLTTGPSATGRYTLVLFPFYILFAQLARKPRIDALFTIVFALLQGCFCALWFLSVMT